ncbi:LLM class flavin-dependent oxidoreductase [Ktedonosporobacter rubrisoli]|uniref:LLM class flavin-dependent oxidoreductase n=1 Tax=Ktedonosporobacter rubrisoli TaxID=2509675 RepID=A0A4P6JLV0_KTERU|nr:LLM class flavin-dependent oxidoreductase [Ktedonosporobacter rubrisoli]QBD76010.1 LLM class flavin-dependent oxidoreductase [Ktedonosporobacter rubrisoli]
MEKKAEVSSLKERIGLSVVPADPAALIANLVEIEEAGVEHIWAGSPPWNPDLLTTLAAAAMRTKHLKLGTSIVQAFVHPVHLARQVLSFNAQAPGRLRLGIGSSSPEFARRVYGIEMGSPLAYLREYAQVLRTLLHQGEVNYQGRYFTTNVPPQASTQIPVFLATLGPKAFRLAGEVADGALPVMCPVPYLLNTAIPAMSAGAAAAGRPRPPVVGWVPIALTEDRATALQIGRQAMSIYPTRPAYRNMFLAAGFSPQEIDSVSDNFIESVLVYGDESKIRDRLLELLALGIDELTIGVIPVSNATQESLRLARLIGRL